MESIIISVETEIELQRVTDSLHSYNVPFVVKRLGDSSFPSVSMGGYYAEISIPSEYRATATQIAKTILNRVPMYAQQVPAKPVRKVWLIGMLIYSLVISVIAFRYWYIHEKSSVDKNFDFQWSYDGSWLHLVNKATGKDGNLYIDKNLNNCFEEILTYSDSGFMVTKSFDRNEDGRYEQFLNYNHNGDLVINMIDLDDDGVIDEMQVAVQGDKVLRLTDKNKDGIFEIN